MARPMPRTDAPDPEAVLAAHSGLVWTICRRLSPDPDDAFQDVWEKVLEGLPRFDPTRAASIATWIAVVAHRALVDRHRRRKVRGDVLPLPEIAANGPDVEELAAGREGVAALEDALALLPADQRRVVVLHHVHGLELEAIAAGEGVPLGTVKSRLHRGRAALVARLGGTR
jgi:RNA polymerase sigma-70 factor (ECF subfamily)